MCFSLDSDQQVLKSNAYIQIVAGMHQGRHHIEQKEEAVYAATLHSFPTVGM